MATWTATRGTDTLAFDGNPYKLVAIEGIGSPPMRRLDERGPLQDGVTDLGYRMDARIIDLVIWFQATSESVLDGYRDTLLEFFKPKSSTPVKLKVTRADNGVRQIDGFVTGAIDAPATAGDRPGAKAQKVGIQLRCANPIWYDPTPQTSGTWATGITEWQYGGGVIGTSNLLASTVTPSAGATASISGAVAFSTGFTVVARTARPTTGTVVAFQLTSDGDNMAQFEARGSVNYAWSRGAFTSYGSNDTSGSAVYFFIGKNNEMAIKRDGTTLAWSGDAIGGVDSTLAMLWRGSSWGSAVSHAAVYNIPLTATQQTALRTSIANTSSRYSGTVQVSGNWDDFPVITLAGPINDPVVTNLTTGEVLDFTGATIAANEYYTIDTRYGHKTIYDQTGANKVSTLAGSSDLGTFHLEPGGNLLQVTFTGGTSVATAVTMNYHNRYISP